MLNLHFAPSADRLVPILLDKLRLAWTDPFKPPVVLVPSPSVGKWLTLRLADSPDTGFGCVANLEMQTLERFLWSALCPEDTMQRLDVAVLQQVVCALLDENLLEDPVYKPLYDYLSDSNGRIDPVKRVQLSSKIARRFQEYEFNRPSVWIEGPKPGWKHGIDAVWLKGESYNNDTSADAAWQKDLYCKVDTRFDQAGSPQKARYLSLPRLYRTRREKGLSDGTPWTVDPATVFLFGVSKVSHFHRNTLVEISQMPGVAMHVFLTNPCAEFWEDVDTWRNRSRTRRAWNSTSKKEDAGITPRESKDYEKEDLEDFVQLPRDHALLELWGYAGKADIFLWCPPAEWNFEYYCPEEELGDKTPETLLGALQYSLLRREKKLPDPPGGGRWKRDGSLEVLACPDPAREVEELRERILDLVAEDRKNNREPCIRLNEIAVYLPDPGDYLAHIHRVFGAFRSDDPGFLPYLVLGAPGGDSLFAQGMHSLLEIIEGRFDRARVFSLLRNPIVRATRGISSERVTIWEVWAGELGMYRGFNKAHRDTMGDRGQMLTDVHTFELGIARLMLGNLAAGPVGLRYKLSADDGDGPFSRVPPYRDFGTGDAESVEQFCGLCEDLFSGATLLADMMANGQIPDTVDAIAGIVGEWFGTVPEEKNGSMTAEARVRNEFLDALQAVKLQKDPGGREKCDGVGEFVSLVKACLPRELPAGSRAWTGGITFAPLRPSMVVPHKVIFVLGLGATAFPGTSETPAWDLLARKRIVGDSDRVRDNRFAFLELLHAARERLILSFRARNMHKEEDLQPSSVVLELESYLREQGLTVTGSDTKEEQCSIRREIPWMVHESLDEIRRSGRLHGSWDAAEIRLARLDGGPKVGERYMTAGVRGSNEVHGPLRTDLHGLRKYFANPLEYHLSKTLGIELDEQPGTMGATDEPLRSGNLEMSGLHKAIWTGLLEKVFPEDKKASCTDTAALGDWAESIALNVHRDYRILAGSPEAQFSSMERNYLVSFARKCAPVTLGLLDSFGNHKLLRNADLSLGRSAVPGDLVVDMGNMATCTVACRHLVTLVPREKTGAVGIIAFRKEGKANENPDLWLEGVIQWLAGKKGKTERDISLIQLNYGDGKKKNTGCSRAEMKRACDHGKNLEEWLAGFIREMLIEKNCDHLPFAVIQTLHAIGDDGRLDLRKLIKDNIEEELEKEFSPYRCYLEAFALVEARIPDISPEELRERARDRYAPMLEGWVHE